MMNDVGLSHLSIWQML